MPNEKIEKSSAAATGPNGIHLYLSQIYLTNLRIVVLNNASNMVFNGALMKMDAIFLEKAPPGHNGIIRIISKDGSTFFMTVFLEGTQIEDKHEMNSWFNYVDQFIKNRDFGK